MAYRVAAGSGERGADGERGPEGDAGEVGQAIASRLFSAGMDLHFALMLTGDGVVASKLLHAIGEVDEALKGLRHLMLDIAPADHEMAKVPTPRTSRP